MSFKTFLISGIPGTGKTSVTKKLHDKYSYAFISIGDVVIAKNLYNEEDKNRDTKVVDPTKLNQFFFKVLARQKEDIILEGHYSDMIEHSSIVLAVVLRCHPRIIEKRLKRRGYSRSKINENIQAELVGDSTSFMFEKEKMVQKSRIFELDVSEQTIESIADQIHEIFLNPNNFKQFLAGSVSWLSDATVAIEKYL
jgi:adenylate kinase